MKLLVVLATVFVCALAAEKGFKLNHRSQTPKVVGGENAALGEVPHQLSLQWGFFGFYQHVCGASILNENWIVTAAHCKTELPDGDYQVIAGIISLSGGGQTADVSTIIVHPEYQGGVNPNDIALMRLSSPLSFNENVKPAVLPGAGDDPTGDALLSGWGSTSTTEDPVMPNDLKKATLPILTHQECVDALTVVGGTPDPLAETNICTGPIDKPTEETSGACSGDSGGPLSQGSTLIGIVSWGFFPCGTQGAPSVFTRVSSFLDFINSNAN